MRIHSPNHLFFNYAQPFEWIVSQKNSSPVNHAKCHGGYAFHLTSVLVVIFDTVFQKLPESHTELSLKMTLERLEPATPLPSLPSYKRRCRHIFSKKICLFLRNMSVVIFDIMQKHENIIIPPPEVWTGACCKIKIGFLLLPCSGKPSALHQSQILTLIQI